MTINVSFNTHSHTALVTHENLVDGEWKVEREEIVKPENSFTQCVYKGKRMIIEETDPANV